MSEDTSDIVITPLGESVLEAFLDAYMKKYPELTREQARQKIAKDYE